MIQHFVFLRYEGSTPRSHIDEFCTRMLALKDEIAEIRTLEIGKDILQDERSWDLMLVMQFESVDLLRSYQLHPAHQAAVEFNQPYVADVGSVDFEVPFSG